MTIHSPSQPFIKGGDAENVWNEHHDVDATHEAIQVMLAGGIPNWVKWPQDYKSYAKEAFAEEKAKSDRMGLEYRWADQDMLTNAKARKVNPIKTREFLERWLKPNGVKFVVMDNGYRGIGGVPTVGLWCTPPTNHKKLRYVCYLDVPLMWEWSVLHLDEHKIPCGEKSRGWRTVAQQLVEKDIITEAQCHKIFGVPSPNVISARYFRSLWEKRHQAPYVDKEVEDEGAVA
jgi:hypothetical protein